MDVQLKYLVPFAEKAIESISFFTLECNTLYLNKSGQDLVGFSKNDEITDTSIESFFSFDSKVKLSEVAIPALFQKGSWCGELQIEHLFTGQHIDVLSYLFFIDSLETGEPSFICMTQRDIRGQKETEKLIFEENQILEAFMDNLPEHIYVKDSNCRFMRVNKAMARWLGCDDPDELVGKWDFDVFSEKHAAKAYADEIEIMETGSSIKNLIEMETWPDREDTWVRTTKIPLYDSDNKCVGIIGVSSDINELIMAEKKIREAHKQTETLLASISSILIGVGPNEEITQWNGAAEQTFGISENVVKGKKFLECGIDWDWIEVLEQIALRHDNEKLTKLHDVRFTRPDNTEGFLDITVNNIGNQSVEKAGYLLIATEITERKKLESQLSQAQKLESIGQLAAGIAHEINTPIQYIGDNVHFLKEAVERVDNVIKQSFKMVELIKGSFDKPELTNKFEVAVEENNIEYIMGEIPVAIDETMNGLNRVTKIVKAMKEFSHPGNDKKSLQDINSALQSTITVSKNEWKYVAEMQTNFDSDLPPVPCLPGELNQVFLNLIVNAAHAIAEVTNQGKDGLGQITVSSGLSADAVEIRISDTGTGIDPKITQKIFDPFFTTKEVGKGTGQGLAISHNVITEKHGGTLTFESELGKGTTFVIRLPVK